MKKFIYLLGIIYVIYVVPGCKKSNLAPLGINAENEITPKGANKVKEEPLLSDPEVLTGKITVRMVSSPSSIVVGTPTDPISNQKSIPPATINFSQVNVDIRGLQVLGDGGWEDVQIKAGVYDLLKLESKLGALLTENFPVKNINYSAIALIFGEGSTVVVEGVTYKLLLPNPIPTEYGTARMEVILKKARTAEITLNFDAKGSVLYKQGIEYYNPKPEFKLMPALKVTSVTYPVPING